MLRVFVPVVGIASIYRVCLFVCICIYVCVCMCVCDCIVLNGLKREYDEKNHCINMVHFKNPCSSGTDLHVENFTELKTEKEIIQHVESFIDRNISESKRSQFPRLKLMEIVPHDDYSTSVVLTYVQMKEESNKEKEQKIWQ